LASASVTGSGPSVAGALQAPSMTTGVSVVLVEPLVPPVPPLVELPVLVEVFVPAVPVVAEGGAPVSAGAS